MSFPLWFPSPARQETAVFKQSVLHVDIDDFCHLSFDEAWHIYRGLLRTAHKNSLHESYKRRFEKNANFRTQVSFNTLTPLWFCGMLDCRVNGASKFDPFLVFEENSLPRKRHVRRSNEAITEKIHGLIASFYVIEPTFSVQVINYYVEQVSSPLPRRHHGEVKPLTITVQPPPTPTTAPIYIPPSTPADPVQPSAVRPTPYNAPSPAQQAFRDFPRALLEHSSDNEDLDTEHRSDEVQSAFTQNDFIATQDDRCPTTTNHVKNTHVSRSHSKPHSSRTNDQINVSTISFPVSNIPSTELQT